MKKLAFAVALSAMLAAPFASAQMKPEDQIKFRKAAFNVIAYNFGNIGAMANDRKPYNKAEAEKNAAVIAGVADMPWTLFGAGTDANTKAKSEIWKEQDKFKGLANDMQAATVKLAAASKADLPALKTAFADAAKTCKACHDAYRAQ